MKAWVNGAVVDEKRAVVSIFDHSYLYGTGVFETFRIYNGQPAFFFRHMKRLRENARRLAVPFSRTDSQVRNAIIRLLKANRLKETVLRMTASVSNAGKTNLSLFCRPVAISDKFFEMGVKVLPLRHFVNDSPRTAGIKSTSYLVKMLARAEAARAKAHDALLKNVKGHWVEGSRTNLFLVFKGVVITPPLREGLLPGITRDVVLEILRKKKIPHRLQPVTDALLKKADAIFLTGSTSEILPVCEIIGMGWRKKGPFKMAGTLRKEYLLEGLGESPLQQPIF